jgi:DNA invertase Pin-like site-specific DNA recombinase
MTDSNGMRAPLLLQDSARTSRDIVDARSVGQRVDIGPSSSRQIRVVGYATVTADEKRALVDLHQQSETIELTCAREGLSLVEIVHEREPRGGHVLKRPGLGYALARIAADEAEGLVVAELGRLTHSMQQLGRVLEWFLDFDARLIAATPGLDTDDQSGRLAVRTIVDISKRERDRLIERTRNGMRAARRKGPPAVADFPEVRARIVAMRTSGMTLQAIADQLNAEDVPTVRGGTKWRPSSVQAATGYRRPWVPRTSGFLIASAPEQGVDHAVDDEAVMRNRRGAPGLPRIGGA